MSVSVQVDESTDLEVQTTNSVVDVEAAPQGPMRAIEVPGPQVGITLDPVESFVEVQVPVPSSIPMPVQTSPTLVEVDVPLPAGTLLPDLTVPVVLEVEVPGAQGPRGEQGGQGVQGDPGTPGAATNVAYHYVHSILDQPQWDITHNLGYKPAGILVEDTGGTVWEPDEVTHIDNNEVILLFRVAGNLVSFTGDAWLS